MLDCRHYCCLLSITVTYEFFSPFPFSGRNDYGNNFSLNYWESKYFKNLMAQGYSSMFSWVIFFFTFVTLGSSCHSVLLEHKAAGRKNYAGFC